MIGNDVDPNLALVDNQGKSIPQLFGIIHYISGCYYIKRLLRAVVKHMDFVFSRDIDVEHLFNLCPEFVEERKSFNINFLCALYRFKYNSCFKESETLPELMNGELDWKDKTATMAQNCGRSRHFTHI